MSIEHPSRSEPSGRARVDEQWERHTQAYRKYLLDRGNAASYMRSSEAAVVHLSMSMAQDGSVALRIFQEKIFNKINGSLFQKILNATEPLKSVSVPPRCQSECCLFQDLYDKHRESSL